MNAIHVTERDGVGRIVLDHPPLNILTRAVLAELRRAFESLADNRTLRVLLLSAHGKHFSAGASVEEHLPPAHAELIPEFMNTVAALDDFPVPTVAAVHGRCLGAGFELVLATDIVVAADTATLGQPEIRLGVFPPAACALLPTRVSRGAAARIVFTGDAVTATEAHGLGLVTQVVADAELEEVATTVAARIARHSAGALRLAKRALRHPDDPERRRRGFSYASDIYLHQLMRTDDAAEGLHAFLEKRRPAWSHQ